MKDDIAITEFYCEDCGKKVRVQTVYDILVKKCSSCYFKYLEEINR